VRLHSIASSVIFFSRDTIEVTETKKRSDILEELLRGSQYDKFPGLEGLNDLVRRCASPDGLEVAGTKTQTTPIRKIKLDNVPRKRSESGYKKMQRKTTHYLSQDIFATLDETKDKIREQIPEKFDKISRSKIINNALQLILHDFDLKGEDSALVKQLLKQPKDKNSSE